MNESITQYKNKKMHSSIFKCKKLLYLKNIMNSKTVCLIVFLVIAVVLFYLVLSHDKDSKYPHLSVYTKKVQTILDDLLRSIPKIVKVEKENNVSSEQVQDFVFNGENKLVVVTKDKVDEVENKLHHPNKLEMICLASAIAPSGTRMYTVNKFKKGKFYVIVPQTDKFVIAFEAMRKSVHEMNKNCNIIFIDQSQKDTVEKCCGRRW